MPRFVRTCAGALLLTSVVGCSAGQKFKEWFYGGPSVQRQQQTAAQFDPYPEQDIAPEALGTRPPAFETNVSETQRSRWWKLGY